MSNQLNQVHHQTQNHPQQRGISLGMVKYKLIVIVLLIVMHERAEFTYYWVDTSNKIPLLLKLDEAKRKSEIELSQDILWEEISKTKSGIEYNENAKEINKMGSVSFRPDSFISYASTRAQFIIFSVILIMLVAQLRKPLTIFLAANILYFLEYFLTYNEPIGKIDLFSGLYLPISIATVRTFALLYLFAEAVRITFYKK